MSTVNHKFERMEAKEIIGDKEGHHIRLYFERNYFLDRYYWYAVYFNERRQLSVSLAVNKDYAVASLMNNLTSKMMKKENAKEKKRVGGLHHEYI